MKKIILLAIFLAPAIIYAQGFQLGVKGGVNISNFTGGDIDSKSLIGFHAGAMLGFKIGNNFILQPEVLLSSQGAKADDVDDTKYKLTYINVPVMAKFKTDGGFYIEAGPQVGFKINESTDDQTISNFAKDLDLSIAGGLGFHSSMGLGIGARYIAGLSKVGDFDAGNTEPNFKNSVIQVSVFYTLFNNK